MTGKGFARRVTRDNLAAFAPLLKSVSTTSGGASGPGVQVEISLPPDPLLAAAESLFSGERLRITNPFPRQRAKPVVPAATVAVAVASPSPLTTAVTDLVLMWQSKSLTRRDLTIPEPGATNKTGSINLDKGLLESHIDHRHYFRDTVFSGLSWKYRSGTVDESTAKFRLFVKGTDCGELTLKIRHTTSTDTESYFQKNAMTRLSWGQFKTYIAKTSLIGLTLSLYRSISDTQRFVLKLN